jgi:hypothetical protein
MNGVSYKCGWQVHLMGFSQAIKVFTINVNESLGYYLDCYGHCLQVKTQFNQTYSQVKSKAFGCDCVDE